MFTGIVEEIGSVSHIAAANQGYIAVIRAQTVLEGTKPGDSIAVSGVCLTVTRLDSSTFTVGISSETRVRSNLLSLQRGSPVHLERAVTPTTRLGGHFVQGHVDGTGTITGFRHQQDTLWVTVAADPMLIRYLVPKGFVALDGVSLTVVDVFSDHFTIALVPYTQHHVTLPQRQIGYQINIEVDVLGKYVEKLCTQPGDRQQRITAEFLTRHGF